MSYIIANLSGSKIGELPVDSCIVPISTPLFKFKIPCLNMFDAASKG